MKSLHLALPTLFALLFAASLPAGATSTFPLIDKADLICLATYEPAPSATAAAVPAQKETGATAPPPALVTQAPQTEHDMTMHVVQTWKGTPPAGGTLALKVVWRPYSAQQPFRPVGSSGPFVPHVLYLVFAVRQPGSSVFAQVMPNPTENVFDGIVPMTRSAITIDPTQPLLERFVKASIECLADPDPHIRSTGRDLAAFKWLFIDGARAPKNYPAGVDSSVIKSVIVANALPRLDEMVKSKDEDIRIEGIALGAQLQQIQVIPALAATANETSNYGQQARSCLMQFVNKSAVPAIIPLLKSPDVDARKATIVSLQMHRDRRSLPYLIDVLSDADPSIVTASLDALFTITSQPANYAAPQKPSDIAGYVKYWTDWAKSNDDEVEKLRSQAGEASHPG